MKVINIVDKENNLIASLEIDWKNRTINVVNHDNYKILEDEAFACVK
jgi:uncharacterized protein YkvS